MHPSPSQKTVPMVLKAESIVFGFSSWAMLCDANSCCHFFPDQRDEIIFHCQSWCHKKKSQPLTTYPFINCDEYLSIKACVPPTASEKPTRHKLCNILNFPVPPRWCCALLQYLLTFLSMSHTDSLWLALWFFLCFSQYMHTSGHQYRADWQCLRSHLWNVLPIVWHC